MFSLSFGSSCSANTTNFSSHWRRTDSSASPGTWLVAEIRTPCNQRTTGHLVAQSAEGRLIPISVESKRNPCSRFQASDEHLQRLRLRCVREGLARDAVERLKRCVISGFASSLRKPSVFSTGDAGPARPSGCESQRVRDNCDERDRRGHRYFLFNSSSAQYFVPEISAEAINPLSLSV